MAGRLAQGYFFIGELDKALPKADLAIELSESIGSPEALARAFSLHGPRGCRNEAGAVDRTPQAESRDRPRARSL